MGTCSWRMLVRSNDGVDADAVAADGQNDVQHAV